MSGIDMDVVFKGANLLVSVIMVVDGLIQVGSFGGVRNFIVGAYVLVFGLANASLEFMPPHEILDRYAHFLFSFAGRGLFYILVGGLLIGESVRHPSSDHSRERE